MEKKGDRECRGEAIGGGQGSESVAVATAVSIQPRGARTASLHGPRCGTVQYTERTDPTRKPEATLSYVQYSVFHPRDRNPQDCTQ